MEWVTARAGLGLSVAAEQSGNTRRVNESWNTEAICNMSGLAGDSPSGSEGAHPGDWHVSSQRAIAVWSSFDSSNMQIGRPFLSRRPVQCGY